MWGLLMRDHEIKPVASGAGRSSCVLLSAILLASAPLIPFSPASSQSLSDRFKTLFGGQPEESAQPAAPPPAAGAEPDLTCPPVAIRPGAATYAVAAPGKQPVGNDVRFQATIGRTARECVKTGDQITARIGIQGRIIAGPAGAPTSIEIPLRIAVVQGGVGEKVIATKAYHTTVAMSETGSEPFTLVAEDLVYPVPLGGSADSYVFYIGFDPQSLKAEPKAKPKPAKKR